MLFEANCCCCGCSLQDGSLSIMVVSFILSIIILIWNITEQIGRQTIFILCLLAIDIAGLYGYYKDKPRFMLPYFGLQLGATAISSTLALFFLYLMVLPYPKDAKDLIPDKVEGLFGYGLAFLICVAFAGMKYHFACVVFSYYKERDQCAGSV